MADEDYTVIIQRGDSQTRSTTFTGEVYRKTAKLSGAALTTLSANLDASTETNLSAAGIAIINLVRAIDVDAPDEWDATNKATVENLLDALTADVVDADSKAALSDLTTMLETEDASFTSGLKTNVKDLLALIEADGLAADDIAIIGGITTALAAADASYDATAKDALARLLALIIADTSIAGVITAIETAEGA